MNGPALKYNWHRICRGSLGRKVLLVCLLVATAATTGQGAAEADLSRPDPAENPTRVNVSLYMADLYEISGADQAILADVVIQAEWVDPRLAGRWTTLLGMDLDDVWNPRLQLVNQRGVSASLPQRVEVDPTGRVRYRQRWWGRFSTRMDLKEFPLDKQSFSIQVVSLGYTRDGVDLVVNSETLPSGRAKDLSVTDWEIGPAVMEAADLEPAPGVKALAGARLQFEGQRYVGYYVVQVILPLILIVLMGWTALLVDPTVVTTRMSVSMTTMLTLIAYRFALGRSVPNLPYLTRFDYFMLASTILIFLTLLLVAVGAYLVGKGKAPLVHAIDRRTRVVFPIVFAVVLAAVWWG